jgi:hypothetical protein
MAQAPTVGVVGLRALRRDIDKLAIDGGWMDHELSMAGKTAAEPVAAAVREAVPRSDNELTGHSGQLAGDVRVLVSRSGASVRMGRVRVPYAGPVDFGWPAHGIDFIPTGRYMWPAATAMRGTAASLYSSAAQKAIDTFTWTNETNNAEGVHD